jgi:hypothetical protein
VVEQITVRLAPYVAIATNPVRQAYVTHHLPPLFSIIIIIVMIMIDDIINRIVFKAAILLCYFRSSLRYDLIFQNKLTSSSLQVAKVSFQNKLAE